MNWSEADLEAYYGKLRSSSPNNVAPVQEGASNLRGGVPKDRMNKWEREYAQQLEARRVVGEIVWWGFESIKLRLADNTFYTPDFAVVVADTVAPTPIQFIEIKGFLRDDANVKFKVARETYPWATFMMLRRRKQKEGGGWEQLR